MKKFIIVLMVVAAASFLLVGCLPGTTTPVTPVEPVEPVEPVVVATVAPIITAITDAADVVLINLTSAATQYMNKAEVAAGIIVHGTAPTYSEVKVYVDDICAGTGNTGDTGVFEVVVAKADLGSDAVKTLYATAKEAAIAVSAHSVEYTFTLDTDLPGIDSVAATADAAATGGTSVETDSSAVSPIVAGPTATAADVEDGVWTIMIHGTTAVLNNMSITDPDGVVTYYTVTGGEVFAANGPIPGVTFTLAAAGVLAAAQYSQITCVVEVAAIVDRYTLKFDEDVDFTGAAAGVYDIFITGAAQAPGDPDTYKEGNDTCYWDTEGILALGNTVTFTVYGVTDLAGNPGGTLATPLTSNCFAGLASATSLAP